MHHAKLNRLVWIIAGMFLLNLSSIAMGQTAATVSVDVIERDLKQMGYDPKLEGHSLSIDAGFLNIDLSPSKNGRFVYLYSYYNVSPDRAGKLPMKEMLAFNDDSDIFFSISSTDGKISSVSINTFITAQDVNNVTLRQAIDAMNDVGHREAGIFDPSGWK